MKTRTVLLVSAVAFLVIIAVAVVGNLPNQPSNSSNLPPPAAQSCKGSALCLSREVVRMIDGDTLDIVGGIRIRLVLVNAAMIHSGYASLYTRFCSVSEFQYEPWTGCP